MKTETKTETHLIIGEGTPESPMARIIIGLNGDLRGPGIATGAGAELIERIAAALAEHRARDFDQRSVCADHGYFNMRDSASGYKCSSCDPKPKAPEVDPPAPVIDGVHNGVPL